jgi:hypothetical protein
MQNYPGNPYGPPPGGQPPGYGPPPGGGYGPPPGGGYGPPPGGPMMPGPGAQPPKKKSNVGLFLALGCLGLLLVGGIFAALAIGGVSRYLDSARAAGAGTKGGSAVASGSTCAAAAACCQKITARTGAAPNAQAACENLKKAGMPELGCRSALDTYRKTAGLLGVTCE